MLRNRKISDVKVMLVKGADGSGIDRIELTESVGLVDTYTIYFEDGRTTEYEVTNGNGIESIEKTATAGLYDTYTITFDNGETFEYQIRNGDNGTNDLLALVCPTSSAPQAFAVGDHLIYNNKYYVVKAPISLGDSISVGVNIEETLVGNETSIGGFRWLSGTLLAGQTTVDFNDYSITSDSMFDVFMPLDKIKLIPDAMEIVSANTLRLTFGEAQSADVAIKIKVSK